MIRNPSKLPKRKVTIDEILGRDDITDIVNWIMEDVDDIKELIVVKVNYEDECLWRSNKVAYSRFLWWLESIKQTLFYEDDK